MRPKSVGCRCPLQANSLDGRGPLRAKSFGFLCWGGAPRLESPAGQPASRQLWNISHCFRCPLHADSLELAVALCELNPLVSGVHYELNPWMAGALGFGRRRRGGTDRVAADTPQPTLAHTLRIPRHVVRLNIQAPKCFSTLFRTCCRAPIASLIPGWPGPFAN